MQGKLYVVATPIGNLADMTYRAVDVLGSVALIAAEDTRHTRMLLGHYGINTPMTALHQHNEGQAAERLIARMRDDGDSLALVSDAGTPLIRDPGYVLVEQAVASGIDVVPVPGCCALITALSAAGLPAAEFAFAGFPPRTASARQAFFQAWQERQETLIVYESSHRVVDCVTDIRQVFGDERQLCLARELTKRFETFIRGSVAECLLRLQQDSDQQKGEFVLLLAGKPPAPVTDEASSEETKLLAALLKELSVKSAVKVAMEITGGRKKVLYQEALRLTGQED